MASQFWFLQRGFLFPSTKLFVLSQRFLSSTKMTEQAPKRIKVYTRTGDKGTSSLFTGERRGKQDGVFEALGTTDELSSSIGLAREFCLDHPVGIEEKLEEILCVLIDVGACIATPRSSASDARLKRTEFDEDGSLVAGLESDIDKLDEQLPPLRNFILPSGGKASASLHMARGVCRRTERRVVGLIEAEEVSNSVGIYLNRLSDYLFTAARFTAHKHQKPEIIYQKRKGKFENPNVI